MGGYTSQITLLPDVNGGVYVAVNGPDSGAKDLIVMHLMDHLLGSGILSIRFTFKSNNQCFNTTISLKDEIGLSLR